MTRQQLFQRMTLGAFAVALALPAFGVAAEDNGFVEGLNSAGLMQGTCEEGGGIYSCPRLAMWSGHEPV